MSEIKHTSGEWYTKSFKWIYADGNMIAKVFSYDPEDDDKSLPYKANAQRIVACVNACKGIDPEAVPDLLDALEMARQFVRNGIEYGYIVMPDNDTSDPAHKTLPVIEVAIAKARRK